MKGTAVREDGRKRNIMAFSTEKQPVRSRILPEKGKA